MNQLSRGLAKLTGHGSRVTGHGSGRADTVVGGGGGGGGGHDVLQLFPSHESGDGTRGDMTHDPRRPKEQTQQ